MSLILRSIATSLFTRASYACSNTRNDYDPNLDGLALRSLNTIQAVTVRT